MRDETTTKQIPASELAVGHWLKVADALCRVTSVMVLRATGVALEVNGVRFRLPHLNQVGAEVEMSPGQTIAVSFPAAQYVTVGA